MSRTAIDTRKKVRFYDDTSKVKEVLTLKKILYQNDNVCLCLVEGGEDWMLFGEDGKDIGEVLFRLKDGEVLTENLQFWYATDRKPPE